MSQRDLKKKTAKNMVLAAAVMGVSALSMGGTVLTSSTAEAAGSGDKCYGVARAGENDCGAATHSCAGQAASDYDGAEWRYVPAGTCDDLGGRLEAFDNSHSSGMDMDTSNHILDRHNSRNR